MAVVQHARGAHQRYFAIGDVHGCADELELLLSELPLQTGDCLVFLGDYVDRGPDSRKVIDLILQTGRRWPVVSLRGNHESMMLDFLERPESVGAGLFVLNGGMQTLASYGDGHGDFLVPEEHHLFLRGLSVGLDTPDFFFVHAGVPDRPLNKLSESDADKMLWIRDSFFSSSFNWGKRIVHGHTPVDKPETHAKRINVDTGCVYDRRLTAVELPAVKFYSVERQKLGTKAPALREPDSARRGVRFSGRLRVRANSPAGVVEGETHNFNQFGLLMDVNDAAVLARLKPGDVLQGEIGVQSEHSKRFAGRVVRAETRSGHRLLAVQIDQLGKQKN